MPSAVDTSIYKPLMERKTDPFGAVKNLGSTANALAPLMVGRAVQEASNPETGQINQNKVLDLLRQNPIGASQAIPTMDALARLRQAGFAADQAGLETFQKRMATAAHLFGVLASKKNPTMDDVYDAATMALDPVYNAKEVGITLPVIMNMIKQFRGLTPKQIKEKAILMQTQAATTQEALGAHAPRYEWQDTGQRKVMVPVGTQVAPAMGTTVRSELPPGTPVATPQGQRYLGPQPQPPGLVQPPLPVEEGAPLPPAQGGAPSAAPGMPTGPAASLPPGYVGAAESVAAAGASNANALMQANDSSMMRKAMLGNLEDDLRKFEPGPGAEWTKVAKAWANRNLPVPESWKAEGGILDMKSIASQEQFNKQAAMLAQAQFQTIGGTGTDAKFSSAFTTSPNEYLSKLGNVGIIRLLKGNEDAIQAKNAAWQKWRKAKGPDTYADFSADFNAHFDPRVFQFKYIPAKERQEYIDHMDSNERMRFLRDLTYARKQGWVNFGAKK